MISLPDSTAILAAPTLSVPHALKLELERLAQQTSEAGLLDLTHILVIEHGDAEDAIIAEIGFSPLVDPVHGVQFGDPGFRPYWAWLEDRRGWFQLVHTVGNEGFAFILLVEDCQSELSAMCRGHAWEGGAA